MVKLFCSILAIALLCVPALSWGQNDSEEISALWTSNLKLRAQELNEALEKAYKNGDIKSRPAIQNQEIDITDIVASYIPVKTSFADAETILREAGFKVEPHPDLNQASDPDRPNDWYAVTAHMRPSYAQGIYEKSYYHVILMPFAPGNYSLIAHVKANYVWAGP